MKLSIIAIIFLNLSLLFPVFASDEIEIRQTVLENIEAHQRGDFAQGYALLNTKSKNYFNTTLERVLYANKEEVQAMPFLDKVVLLRVRNQLDADILKTFQAKDLYLYLNEMGNHYPKEALSFELEAITISEDAAVAELKFPGDERLSINLTQETDAWKIDLLSFLQQSSQVLEDLFSSMEPQMRDQLFPTVIESMSDKPFDESSWNPILSD